MYKRSLNGFENDAGALFVSIYCSFVITPLTQLQLVSNLLRRITSRHHHSITPRFLSFVKNSYLGLKVGARVRTMGLWTL